MSVGRQRTPNHGRTFVKKSGAEKRAEIQEHFSQRHLTREERRDGNQRKLARGYIEHSRPPWYLYVQSAEKSDDPVGDGAFLEERRVAGDIIIPDDRGGHFIFKIGTPQDHIDHAFERMRERAAARAKRR